MEYFAVALAWLIPGAGHFLINQRGRGIIFFLVIHILFAVGILVGGVKVLSPTDPNQIIWTYTQYASGWPMLAGNAIQKSHPNAPMSYAKVNDIGTVYCGIAGMLNMLVIFDVLVRSTATGPTEKPGENQPKPTEGTT